MGTGTGPGPGGGEYQAPEIEVPQEILDLRAELEAAKDALHASREALLEELKTDGATSDEIVAALAVWREEHEADILAIQELAAELRDLVQEYRPDIHIDLPDWMIAKREQLRIQRQELAQSRRQAIAGVEDPTEENIRAALEQWRNENQEQIQATHQLAMEIRNWFRENRPDRPDPVMTGAMVQRREQFQTNTAEMRQLRNRLMDPTISEEERLQLREQQRLLLQDRKTLMRQKRDQEGDAGGDRRPGG